MKKIIRFCLPFIAGALLIINARAQSGGDAAQKYDSAEKKSAMDLPIDIRTSVSTFFGSLISGKTTDAYYKLFEKSAILERKDDIKKLIDQTQKAVELYGNIKSYEMANFERPCESFIKVRFLGICEKYPTRWIITFYKAPSDGWVVVNVKFDDLTEDFFKPE